MNTVQNIKIIGRRGILAVAIIVSTVPVFAQRFNHGGGGGGNHGGGGFSRPPMQASRPSYNPPARAVERHEVHEPVIRREEWHGGGRRPGEGRPGGIFHPVYGNHPYAYHTYHPYAWGPRWHPFGFFMSAMAADAYYFTLANQGYYYDYGVFYIPSGNGYTAVPPPVGALVGYLPDGFETVQVGDYYYYYFGGAFYTKEGNSFRVVPAPAGAIIYQLPEGATEQAINGETYLMFNNVYYLPVSQNGQDAYEVIQMN